VAGATLASDGWGAASIMRSAQRAAVSSSPSVWPARTALMWEGSRAGFSPLVLAEISTAGSLVAAGPLNCAPELAAAC
jgi:hypothetical protein